MPTDSLDALSDDGWEPCDEASPEQKLLKENEVQTIQKIVFDLPEKYRLPIHLFYSADMQVSEIAKILHIPEGTAKTRMRKAKKMLKEELEALGYDR